VRLTAASRLPVQMDGQALSPCATFTGSSVWLTPQDSAINVAL
jgi:hypothetical protein